MKDKKMVLTLSIITVLVLTIGITYAIYNYSKISMNSSLVVGDIYMHYNETNQINITNATPMKKEDAIKDSYIDNVFNFTITGKNTSNKDVYYAISIIEGNEIAGKTRISPKDIDVYLKEDDKVVVDGLRYEEWNNTKIWVSTIPANTKTEKTINYQLRIWVDDGVVIGNTRDATYSIDEWNNSYTSVKINVNGNLDAMNMPLKVEENNVENNKSFFIATISNYNNPEEKGQILDNIDKMNLTINNTNNNVLFTYKDSLGNIDNTKKESLNLEYDFNKKTSVEVKVYMESINDTNNETDVIIKSTKNDTENYSLVQKVDIKGNNFCLNNGFTKLSDCLLTSEAFSSSVDEAKILISNKGSVDLNDTAPRFTYIENYFENSSTLPYQAKAYKYSISNDYTFNSAKGTFDLKNKDNSSILEVDLTDDYLEYYSCGQTYYTGNKNCNAIYKIKEVTNGRITKADRITYKIVASFDSEQGLYETTDDLGSTYFFRGDVTNNNVYFGGFYWKVVRINGDGTIRIIYNGTSANASGNATTITKNTFNLSSDPAYVGYMYGGSSNEEIISDDVYYSYMEKSTKYYFADSYEYDTTNKVYKLKMKNADSMKYGTLQEVKDEISNYPYTCKSNSETGTCNTLIKVKEYINETSCMVNYLAHSSIDYETTRKNEYDSIIKTVIDAWYKTNIIDNNLSNYVADNYFCNDRDKYQGDGFSLSSTTYYNGYKRLFTDTNKSVSLTCNTKDKFSVSKSIGNGNLTYPIALITADEVALAGGSFEYKNNLYYLWNNELYWTMTPGFYGANSNGCFSTSILSNGQLGTISLSESNNYVRPVINLNSNVSIKSGDGTMENPYKLS